ncbi:MAG: UPF0149 family protein [Burkholderiaceae bacterium]
MNPLFNIQFPTNSDAELDRLQQLCEQLAGFDERVSIEWLDGAMTAFAAAARAKPLAQWRDALLGDAWPRAFADPRSDAEATAVLDARWRVLLKQLDPELLLEATDELRLAPVMLEWSDEDKAEAVAEGEVAPDDIPHVGGIWAFGFMDVVNEFTDDWPAQDVETEAGQAFRDVLMRIALLTLHDPQEFEKLREELYATETPERDELIQEALFAVQDLRCHWVENAPKPQTRRVEAAPGRNDPCHCGSGKKFKKCHGA